MQFLPAQTELHGLGDGRIVERRVDTWIESELRRFHCGISCVLLLLATVILVAETFRYPRGRDCGALALLLFSLALAQVKRCLRYSPGARSRISDHARFWRLSG